MGVASSFVFDEEKKALIAKRLKSVYEQDLANGKPEEEMRELVLAEYEKIVKSLSVNGESSPLPGLALVQETPRSTEAVGSVAASEVGTPAPKSVEQQTISHFESVDRKVTASYLGKTKKGQQLLAEKEGGSDTGRIKPKQRNSRRRSFDPRAGAPIKTTLAEVAESVEQQPLAVSQSETALSDLPTNAIDTWDSVTTQPYCDICKMAFKNTGFLERHILYSNLHIHNAKVLENGGVLLSARDRVVPVEETTAVVSEIQPVKTADQEEGKDYRLIYSGSKLYWRTQNTVEFDIYHHFATKTIEIIPHNVTHHKELERRYLSYDKALEILHEVIDAEVEARVKAHHSDRFASKIDRSAIKADVQVIKLASFLVSHLHFELDENDGRVIIQELTCDHFPVGFILDAAPDALYPVKLSKRRRSSAEEIEEKTHHVTAHLNMASKLLDTAAYHQEVAKSSTTDEYSSKSPPPHNKNMLMLSDVLENGHEGAPGSPMLT